MRMTRRQAVHALAASLPAAGLLGTAVTQAACGVEGYPPPTSGNGGPEQAPGLDIDVVDGVVVEGEPGVCAQTGADALGPFHEADAPFRTVLAEPTEPGERLLIEGRVLGPDCETPVAGAIVDVWHADAAGAYHAAGETYRLRGQMRTDSDGGYAFESVLPGHYSGRPRHFHFIVSAPGHVPLTTQLYFAGDPYLGPNDSCQSPCDSNDPDRIITLAEAGPSGPGMLSGRFDVVLMRI